MTSSQPDLTVPTPSPVPGRSLPDPEVPERARRRQFTVGFKLRVLQEADACKDGALGGLLRREGLYSSHLAAWRRQRTQGLLDALQPRRGRPPKDPTSAELARLRRENEHLTRKLAAAETVIDIQKKVSALLGITLASADNAGRPCWRPPPRSPRLSAWPLPAEPWGSHAPASTAGARHSASGGHCRRRVACGDRPPVPSFRAVSRPGP